MTIEEKILLDKVLDSLDRLFDGEYTVTTIQLILIQTDRQLTDTKDEINLSKYIEELRWIIESQKPEERKREIALSKTHSLRMKLADIL